MALAAALGTAACAISPPATPTVSAAPGEGKTIGQFQADDQNCRQAAAQANGYIGPKQAYDQGGVASVLFGSAAGAALGAGVGSTMAAVGTGALIGGGVGLVAGGVVAAGVAQAAANSNQHRFDAVYAHCMASVGERVPALASDAAPVPYAAAAPAAVSAAPLASPAPPYATAPPAPSYPQGYAQTYPPLRPAPPAYWQTAAPPPPYAPQAYPPTDYAPSDNPRQPYAAGYDTAPGYAQAYAPGYPPPPPDASAYYVPDYYGYAPPVVYAPRAVVEGYWYPGWRQRYW